MPPNKESAKALFASSPFFSLTAVEAAGVPVAAGIARIFSVGTVFSSNLATPSRIINFTFLLSNALISHFFSLYLSLCLDTERITYWPTAKVRWQHPLLSQQRRQRNAPGTNRPSAFCLDQAAHFSLQAWISLEQIAGLWLAKQQGEEISRYSPGTASVH